MSIESELQELESRQVEAFTEWDYVRQLSSSVPLAHRRGIGAIARMPLLRQLLRGLQRVRYANALSERQRTLNLIALERASKLTQLIDARVAAVDTRINAADNRISTTDQRLFEHAAGVDRRVAEVFETARVIHRDVGKAMEEIHERIDTTTAYVTHQSNELRRDFFNLDRDEDMRERIERAEIRIGDHGGRVDELEEQSRLHGSHIRRLEQGSRIRDARGAAERPHPLAGDRLPRLIALLEEQMPELLHARHVGISIQDGGDDMIAVQAAHFGQRLGMYGTRDDAWYHVDFTADWNRDILFENALSKLRSGGYFVLVSDAQRVDAEDERALHKVRSQVLELAPNERASVHIWQRP